MRALLDINVVIALLDPDHAFHERAHAWWAGCPRCARPSRPISTSPDRQPDGQAKSTKGRFHFNASSPKRSCLR
jgi:hypothetical protein